MAPGSTKDDPGRTVTLAPKRSLPVKRCSTRAPAALKVECPETYSANGGVGKVTGWYGCQVSPRMSRVPRYGPAQASTSFPFVRTRTAVIGRT